MKRTIQDTEALLKKLFAEHFGYLPSPSVLASAPGRVELAGNHTDHQGGCTISAAISQRTWALAGTNNTNEIRVFMDGFGEARLDCTDLDARQSEQGSSVSLIRGMAAAYVHSGGVLRGFDMVTCSDIPVGSGVSSSAAFEVLTGTVLRALFDTAEEDSSLGSFGEVTPHDPTALALDGMWAECSYFGKPCGAQDQLASAYGGVVALDFSFDTPRVTPINFDADASGYTLCLIDSRCDHSHHTDEFAAIPADMHAVAHFFQRTRLVEVPPHDFLAQLSEVRTALGDRAVLRALHFFEENRRVKAQTQALEANDFEHFLASARLSGTSSAQFLQSASSHHDALRTDQPIMVILALCARLLDGDRFEQNTQQDSPLRGAYRIHGGGFGGSVLAFVPNEDAEAFMASLDAILGYDACTPLTISAQGATAVRLV